LTALESGSNLEAAFIEATKVVSDSEIGDYQQPWLDDNGNATPNDGQDGEVAANRSLIATFGGMQPIIAEAQTMLHTRDELGLRSRVIGGGSPLETVWASIYPPSWVAPVADPGEMASTGADLVQLFDPQGDGTYTSTYTFDEQGTYRVVFQAVGEDGMTAMPVSVNWRSTHQVYLPLVLKSH
jgi:hypothetical protein